MIKWHTIPPGYKSRLIELKAMTSYELLNVVPGLSLSELKTAYRNKVKSHHPDKNDPFMKDFSEEYTKLLNAAYEQIKNELPK